MCRPRTNYKWYKLRLFSLKTIDGFEWFIATGEALWEAVELCLHCWKRVTEGNWSLPTKISATSCHSPAAHIFRTGYACTCDKRRWCYCFFFFCKFYYESIYFIETSDISEHFLQSVITVRPHSTLTYLHLHIEVLPQLRTRTIVRERFNFVEFFPVRSFHISTPSCYQMQNIHIFWNKVFLSS